MHTVSVAWSSYAIHEKYATKMTKSKKKSKFIEHNLFHYENLPMQYIAILLALKIENCQLKNFDIFLIFAQNKDCGYTLEPPCRGSSNEYPKSMFWGKNKKNRYTLAYPSFAI